MTMVDAQKKLDALGDRLADSREDLNLDPTYRTHRGGCAAPLSIETSQACASGQIPSPIVSPVMNQQGTAIGIENLQVGANRQLLLWTAAGLLAVGSLWMLWSAFQTSTIAVAGCFLLFPTLIGIWFDIGLSVAAILLPKKSLFRADIGIGERPLSLKFDVPLVIPVIIKDADDVVRALASAHENYLRAADPCVGVVLLADFCDWTSQTCPNDAALREALNAGVMRLNGSASLGRDAVEVLFRHRHWNEFDRIWMGWERKRGKLVEFMRLTREQETSFEHPCPERWRLCPFVMTIDVDTRIEASSIAHLVAIYSCYVSALGASDVLPAILTPTLETLESPVEPLARWLTEPTFYRSALDLREPTSGQLVFGRDSFNGKGLIAIDQFLRDAGSIPVNTVLSHDHLEAILAGACAIDSVSVFEPFPENRADWERRQHRWIRGDSQILPWALRGRSPYATNVTSTLPLHCRLILSRIVGANPNLLLRYLAIIILAIQWPGIALLVAVVSSICAGAGTLHGALLFARSQFNGFKNVNGPTGFGYFVVNGTLRSLGDFVFLQRNVLLGVDAISVTFFRMLKGRSGLLEWYPADAERVLTVRRACEGVMLALAVLLASNGAAIAALMITAWVVVPAAISSVSRIPNPRFRGGCREATSQLKTI